MEREKTEDRKAYWENFYKRLGGVAASIMTIAILSALPDQSQANEGISFKNNKILYIMLNRCSSEFETRISSLHSPRRYQFNGQKKKKARPQSRHRSFRRNTRNMARSF